MLKLLAVPITVFALAAFALACGGSNDDESPGAGGGAVSTPTAAPTAQNDAPPVAAATATAAPGGAAAAVQEITVRAGERGQEYYFELSSTSLRTGRVKVTFTNAGPERDHTFVIRNSAGAVVTQITETRPGQTRTAEFELTAAGTYAFVCDLRGHADRGQRGSLTVGQ